MGNKWKIVGYISLTAWIVVMVLPVFNLRFSGLSALISGPGPFSGVPYFWEALTASLGLGALTVVAFVLARRSSD